jgi:NAD(P)-dependent dehydrogenase (short-subunit alcohol dehydrogenase family)
MKLQGKTALITGGGRGIGRATAHLFAREGADVALVSEVPGEIAAVAAEVRVLGRRALAVAADLRSEEETCRMTATVLGEMGQVDVLVYSAGVAIHGEIATLPTAYWDENFAVNVRGMFLATRALLPHFLGRRCGTIVNIASALGKQGSAMRAAYTASKYAVVGFTKSLALEMRPHGIRVNCVCPGPVATPLRAKNYPNEDPSTITSPEDVAKVVLYLVSDDAVAITGADVDVAWKGTDIMPTVPRY